MKLKLMTVCIIALLVLTVVPMAATAQPAAKSVPGTVLVETVYTWNSTHAFVTGPPTGIISFNTVSGAYACICIFHLAPNTEYYLGVLRHNSSTANALGWVQVKTDAHGHFCASGKVSRGELAQVNELIHEGGVFAVLALTK